MNTDRRNTAICILVLGILISGCEPGGSFGPKPAATGIESTAAATPAVIPTTRVEPTMVPSPTLIPTIEPAIIPGLLKKAFSIQTWKAMNGHNSWRITGRGIVYDPDPLKGINENYQWMDENHLLLFPAVGENYLMVNSRPVVIDLATGKAWLPSSDYVEASIDLLRILLPRWSPDLKVLITAETVGVGTAAREGVTTYTSDGKPVARYPGKLVDVSPSGDRILNADDTWIDLHSGKTAHFAWSSGATPERWLPIWSPDETRVYFCCYFYGDARTGESYTISDENTIFDGHAWDGLHDLHHSHGVWLKDGYILAQFDALYTGPADFIPIFDPNARTFRDFGKMAGIPTLYNDSYKTSISPDGEYIWVDQGANETGYLVDLRTFKSQAFSDYAHPEWSANGKYAIIGSQVFSLATKALRPLPARPGPPPKYLMQSARHPTEAIQASITGDEKSQNETLNLLDVQALSYRKVALSTEFVGENYRTTIFWSPQGDHIAMLAADNSLWQIDYPKLEKLEQLTPPMADVKDIFWSPDGRYVSYIGGTDIYIVDAGSNP